MRYGFAQRLREKFRSSFTLRLDRARARGILKLTGRFEYLRDDDNWSAFKKQLASKNWVAHIQPPPTSQSLAHHVINYLTRYVTGGPISNRRIVSGDSRSVTFLAREGARVGGERTQVPIAISTAEFTDRWSSTPQNRAGETYWVTAARTFPGGTKRHATKTTSVSGTVQWVRVLTIGTWKPS